MAGDQRLGAARAGELPYLVGKTLRGAQHEAGGGVRLADAPHVPAGGVEPGDSAAVAPTAPVGGPLPGGAETQEGGALLELQALGEQVLGPGEKSRCLHHSLRRT